MDRRAFLKSLVIGVAAAAAPTILLAEPEPVRRYWQVGRNAPVGHSRLADWSQFKALYGDFAEPGLFNVDAEPTHTTVIAGIESTREPQAYWADDGTHRDLALLMEQKLANHRASMDWAWKLWIEA